MRSVKELLLSLLSFLLAFQVSYAGRYFDSRVARWTTPDPQLQKYPAWSPYNYGLNNPIRDIDPNGKEVRAYTERLGLGVYSTNVAGYLQQVPSRFQMQALFLGGAAWEAFGPRHSFIRVTTDAFDKVIELGGPLRGHREGDPLASDVKGPLSERSGQIEHSVQRPPGVGDNDFSFENKILEVHTMLSEYITTNQLPTYDGINGPNSNGYIQFLIQAAGGNVTLPLNAVARNVMNEYWHIYSQLLDEHKKKEQEQQGNKQ